MKLREKQETMKTKRDKYYERVGEIKKNNIRNILLNNQSYEGKKSLNRREKIIKRKQRKGKKNQ